jgi:hypothetical protein
LGTHFNQPLHFVAEAQVHNQSSELSTRRGSFYLSGAPTTLVPVDHHSLAPLRPRSPAVVFWASTKWSSLQSPRHHRTFQRPRFPPCPRLVGHSFTSGRQAGGLGLETREGNTTGHVRQQHCRSSFCCVSTSSSSLARAKPLRRTE